VIAWKENERNAIVHKKIRGSEYIFWWGNYIGEREERRRGIINLLLINPAYK